MKYFSLLDTLCERFERFAVSWSIIVMAFVAIANVLSRNLLNHSFTWAEEVTQFTIVWVTFVGMSHAARNGAHIRMSALSDKGPQGFNDHCLYWDRSSDVLSELVRIHICSQACPDQKTDARSSHTPLSNHAVGSCGFCYDWRPVYISSHKKYDS